MVGSLPHIFNTFSDHLARSTIIIFHSRAPENNNDDQYLQISLDAQYILTGMLIQGSIVLDYFASSLKISHSIDCLDFVADETVSMYPECIIFRSL